MGVISHLSGFKAFFLGLRTGTSTESSGAVVGSEDSIYFLFFANLFQSNKVYLPETRAVGAGFGSL